MLCFCVRKAPPLSLTVYWAAHIFTLCNWFPWFHFQSNTACLHSTFLFSFSLHVTNRRGTHRTLHARTSLRDGRSDADQQTKGTLDENRRAGRRAVKHDIPKCCSQGILETCHALYLLSLSIWFGCLSSAVIGLVVTVIV